MSKSQKGQSKNVKKKKNPADVTQYALRGLRHHISHLEIKMEQMENLYFRLREEFEELRDKNDWRKHLKYRGNK